MKMLFRKIFLFLCAVFVLVPAIALAHQPRITTQAVTIVSDPEVSKAYYGQLMDEPHVYHISASSSFNLYVNVLVPDIAEQKKDVSIAIIKDGNTHIPFVVLDGIPFMWKHFWEEFGRDSYWQGPEYKARVEPGDYTIQVWSSNNDSRYSLAIGETEAFDAKEGWNAIKLIPQIKRDFFNESPAGFFLSPFGWGYILVMFVLSFLFGFIYRALLKRITKKTTNGRVKNIGKGDRWLRVVLGLGLFILAVTTSWSPILLFASGFCFFEAIFSWCGLYAAMGKSSCKV
jgi:hypothetical protein